MHTPVDMGAPEMFEAADRVVYVKTVDVDDLPEDVRASARGCTQLYAVHDGTGEQLALVSNRKMAFMLARQHDFSPVPVH